MTVSLMSLIFSCSVLKALPSPPFPESWQRVQLLASLYSEQLCIQLSADQRGVWEARIGVDASVGSA